MPESRTDTDSEHILWLHEFGAPTTYHSSEHVEQSAASSPGLSFTLQNVPLYPPSETNRVFTRAPPGTGGVSRLPLYLSSQSQLTFASQVGNFAFQRMVARSLSNSGPQPERAGTIQAKLTVGAANDSYEQEADRVADEIMRTPASASPSPWSVGNSGSQDGEVQRSPLAASITPLVQRVSAAQVARREPDQHDETKAEHIGLIQTKRELDGQEVGPELETQLQHARGAGRPLEPGVRHFMEPRFGVDFSTVRIHADTRSATLNRALNAHAFTIGPDIFFGEGRYDAQGAEGRRLLAHKLTHVVQQRAGAVEAIRRDTKKRPSGESEQAERQARDHAANLVEEALESGRYEDAYLELDMNDMKPMLEVLDRLRLEQIDDLLENLDSFGAGRFIERLHAALSVVCLAKGGSTIAEAGAAGTAETLLESRSAK